MKRVKGETEGRKSEPANTNDQNGGNGKRMNWTTASDQNGKMERERSKSRP
jgi:hypothetical protein